jgi:hypothetical protein
MPCQPSLNPDYWHSRWYFDLVEHLIKIRKLDPIVERLSHDAELRAMIDRLRERRKAMRGGDGFGHAGAVIGAYKKAISRMEELAELVETPPPEGEPEVIINVNPDCYGNLSRCQCRLIFEKLVSNR